jgi:drug/metabolite transporter (DMT)-like permease
LIVWAGELAALPPDAVRLSILAGVCFLIASITLYVAFKRGPVKLVAPIIGGYPVISLVLASLGGTVPHVTQWVAVMAIMAGISFVAISAQDDDQVDFDMVPTIVIAVLAAISFALTFELGQTAAAFANERLTVAITRLVALGLLLTAMLAMQKRILPDLKTVPLLAFMGLMDTVALFCVLSAGGMDDAHFASATSSVFGLVTVLLSWLFLREKLTIPPAILPLTLMGNNGIAHQHRHGHWANAAWYRCDPASQLCHRRGIDVTNNAAGAVICGDLVNANINHRGAGFDHVRPDEMRRANSHQNNVSPPRMHGNRSGHMMAYCDCGALGHQHHRRWAANNFRMANHHNL